MDQSPDFVADADFKPDSAPSTGVSDDFIPDDQFKPDEEKPTNYLEQAKAGIEGLERGMSFGLSDVARTKLDPLLTGDSPEVIQRTMSERQQQYPATAETGHIIGSTGALIGTGGLGEIPAMGKIGSAAIKGAIDTGMIQGGDELSKSMLGQG